MTTETMKQTPELVRGVQVQDPRPDGRQQAPPPRGEAAPAGTAQPKQSKDGGRRKPKFTRKRLVWSAIVVVIAALVALSFRPTPLEVEVGTVARGPLETTVDAEGVARVVDRYQVAAPVTGRLERITLREGDAVAAGAVLARITPVPLDPQSAAQAQARLGVALAGQQEVAARGAQTQAALEQARRTTSRIREVATAGGMSQDAVERAELELSAAEREHQAALSRSRAAAAEVAAARAALLEVDPGRSSGRAVAAVRSPSAGRVLRIHQQSERVVPAGSPLVEVGDAAGLEVVVDVLSTDAVRIRPGAPVRVVEWGGEGDLEARVRLVEPAGFTKVSTLGVEEQRVWIVADLLQPPAELGDGYRVEARIVTWADADVVKVPNSALFRTGNDWSVFVSDEGRARLRPVQVGHRGAAEAEIREGLREGETVILFPSDQIMDGVRVRGTQR